MAGQSSNQKTISILKPPAEKHGQEVRLCTQKNSYGWTYGKEKVQKDTDIDTDTDTDTVSKVSPLIHQVQKSRLMPTSLRSAPSESSLLHMSLLQMGAVFNAEW